MSDTQSNTDTKTAAKTAPADVLADRMDGEGNLIDPPVIPEYEQRLATAAGAADQVLVDEINDEYTKARVKLARDEVKRNRKRADARRAANADNVTVGS